MDCLQFCRWLENRDTYDVSVADKAMRHAASCSPCHDKLRLDEHLDGLIAAAMAREIPPAGLQAKIDMNLETMTAKRTPRLLQGSGLLAMVLAAIVLVALPFWRTSDVIHSMDEIGQHVIADHTGHGNDVLVVDSPSNLGSLGMRGVDYATIRSQLPLSFDFVGARICPLGPCEGYHLVFRDGGRRISLYLVATEDIGFPLSTGGKYSLSAGHQTVQLWKHGGYVYALIG